MHFPLTPSAPTLCIRTSPQRFTLLGQGRASVVAEAAASPGPDVKPGAVLISVGGGGLTHSSQVTDEPKHVGRKLMMTTFFTLF